jgi:hypothetical protein
MIRISARKPGKTNCKIAENTMILQPIPNLSVADFFMTLLLSPSLI